MLAGKRNLSKLVLDCKSAEDVNRADLKAAIAGKRPNNIALRYEKRISPDRGKKLEPIQPKEEMKREETKGDMSFVKKKLKLKPNFRAENVTGLFKSVKATEQ